MEIVAEASAFVFSGNGGSASAQGEIGEQARRVDRGSELPGDLSEHGTVVTAELTLAASGCNQQLTYGSSLVDERDRLGEATGFTALTHKPGRVTVVDAHREIGKPQRHGDGLRGHRQHLVDGQGGFEPPAEIGEHAGRVAALSIDEAVDTSLQAPTHRSKRDRDSGGRRQRRRQPAALDDGAKSGDDERVHPEQSGSYRHEDQRPVDGGPKVEELAPHDRCGQRRRDGDEGQGGEPRGERLVLADHVGAGHDDEGGRQAEGDQRALPPSGRVAHRSPDRARQGCKGHGDKGPERHLHGGVERLQAVQPDSAGGKRAALQASGPRKHREVPRRCEPSMAAEQPDWFREAQRQKGGGRGPDAQ
ncbi:MAG: hypothetical protein ACRD03_15605 [Acidimicrobiales bacterium]